MLHLIRTPSCYYQPQIFSDPFVAPPSIIARAFSESGRKVSGKKAGIITRIMAVGACYVPSFGFAPNDEAMLFDAAQTAQKEGFVLSKILRIAPINITNGSDFLLDQGRGLKADMVVACLVYHPAPNEKVGDRGIHFSRWTSERHRLQGAWGEAAARAGARIVVTYSIVGAQKEIAGRHFVENGRYKIKQSTVGLGSYEDEPLRIRRDFLVRAKPARRPHKQIPQ